MAATVIAGTANLAAAPGCLASVIRRTRNPWRQAMDERTEIAAMAMEGILIGSFTERPNARPSPAKVAETAVTYADALREALLTWPDPIKPCPTPKV